jgi:ketosteroid isomerase-like protein
MRPGRFPARWRSAGRTGARDAIIAFLRGTAELTAGTYRVELLWTVADDDHLAAVYRARGGRPDGRALDIEQALLVELEGGRWKVVRAQPLDQAAFDGFWSD